MTRGRRMSSTCPPSWKERSATPATSTTSGSAKAGQKLAFEVQTPLAGPPYFNPRLDVLDAKGTVVLTNLRVQDGKIGTVDAKVIQLAPGMLGKLDEEGEYTLRVRDLTSVQGSPDHVYRVLVRPQIPHVGAVRVEPEGPSTSLSAPGSD